MMKNRLTCHVLAPSLESSGKQGLDYQVGISAETAGARAIHMQLLSIPPGGSGKAHKHAAHETAIYALSGRSGCWYGEMLDQHLELAAGSFLYIPADMPHRPYNLSVDEPFVCVIARTDPREQESVTMLPALDALLDERAV